MKQSKMLEFIKQWKSLERRQKDLDYERAAWCAAVRAEFPPGAQGDKRFCECLDVELGISPECQQELRLGAAAFAIVPDQRQWDTLGGFVQIKHLIPLDKTERVAVIGAVTASGYRVATVVRQRKSKDVTHHETPAIVLFAEFIESLDDVPDDIRELARKYVRARALKVAA